MALLRSVFGERVFYYLAGEGNAVLLEWEKVFVLDMSDRHIYCVCNINTIKRKFFELLNERN